MSVRSKPKSKSYLKPDVVMRLFLHEIVAIRNLTTRIQEVDRQLAQEFGRFNRISESIEKENSQILDLSCSIQLFGQNGSRKRDLNSSVI